MKRKKGMCRLGPRGFTLIELLVVISIIALLMAVIMPALSAAKRKAEALICQTRLRDIGTAFMGYRMSNRDQLPPSWSFNSEAAAGIDSAKSRWFIRLKGYYKGNQTNSIEAQADPLFKCPVSERYVKDKYGGVAAAGVYGYNWYFTETGEGGSGEGKDPRYSWWKAPLRIQLPSDLPLVADLDTRDPLGNMVNPSGWRMGVTNPHPAAYAKGWMGGDFRSERHHNYGPAPNHGKRCNFLFADNHVESRDILTPGQWPWLGDTASRQQSGRAFHPVRNPSVSP